MSAYSFVTSMSLEGYEEYGKTLWDTFWAHCDYPLFVVSEDRLPLPVWTASEDAPKHRLLTDDPDWVEFQKNPDDPPDWRFQAKRFSHKVFTLTNPQWLDLISNGLDWLVWIDADVEVFDRIDEPFLQKACQGDVSYLGRDDYPTSECGWVAYNLKTCRPFLERFREIYTSGEIYSHLEWHDSYIFDRVREEIPLNYVNLSKGVPGMHVWPDTVLGEKMAHLKGPLRKKKLSLDGLPESYRSKNEIPAAS